MDSDIWVRIHRKRLFLDHFRSQQGGSFISLSKICGVQWRQPCLCIANVPFNLPLSTFHPVVSSTDSVAWVSYFIQFSSVAQSCPNLFDPMDCRTPGFPVHHQLPELTQTHAHWVGDAIQLSHPLLSSSPPTFNPSQHEGLFQRVSSSHQVAKVLEFQLQHQSFQRIFRIDFL